MCILKIIVKLLQCVFQGIHNAFSFYEGQQFWGTYLVVQHSLVCLLLGKDVFWTVFSEILLFRILRSAPSGSRLVSAACLFLKLCFEIHCFCWWRHVHDIGYSDLFSKRIYLEWFLLCLLCFLAEILIQLL